MATSASLPGANQEDDRLDMRPRITFRAVTGTRGRVYQVPDHLPPLPLHTAFATVELPLSLNWSQPGRLYRLRDRSERARVYEAVLREGGPQDVLTVRHACVSTWPRGPSGGVSCNAGSGSYALAPPMKAILRSSARTPRPGPAVGHPPQVGDYACRGNHPDTSAFMVCRFVASVPSRKRLSSSIDDLFPD